MSKALRRSFIVARESRKHRNAFSLEFIIIGILTGLVTGSFAAGLIAAIILHATVGTMIGHILGLVLSFAWAYLTYIFLSDLCSIATSVTLAIAVFFYSFFAHDCANIYWNDFRKADWS